VFCGPFSHLPLSSFLLSRQIRHLRSTAAVTVVAAVAVSMVAAVEVSMAVAVEAFTAAGLLVAGVLLLEEVTTKAAASVGVQRRVAAEWAVGLMAGLKPAAVLAQAEIVCRMFVRQSTMASGIRSAVPVTG
jgi:hypothetical protein